MGPQVVTTTHALLLPLYLSIIRPYLYECGNHSFLNNAALQPIVVRCHRHCVCQRHDLTNIINWNVSCAVSCLFKIWCHKQFCMSHTSMSYPKHSDSNRFYKNRFYKIYRYWTRCDSKPEPHHVSWWSRFDIMVQAIAVCNSVSSEPNKQEG